VKSTPAPFESPVFSEVPRQFPEVPCRTKVESSYFVFESRLATHVLCSHSLTGVGTQLPLITLGNFTVAPTKFTSGPNAGLYSGGFGTVNPTAGTTGQRAGTLVARIQF